MIPDKNTPVANPTWYSDIRFLFTQTDIDHMGKQGLDLTGYDVVKDNAGGIYGQVSTGNMPPKNSWPAAWVTTFLNWMTNDFPKGTNVTLFSAAVVGTLASPAKRNRKDINSLTDPEVGLLKKAYTGIMAKDPADPNSFFAQAGHHWLPSPTHCQHHVPGYNPWHRAYLVGVENALRSVPGCENITLPYWDITTPFPEVLKSAPFDKYVLPQDIGQGFTKGYATTRYDYATIQQKLSDFGVADNIANAVKKADWEDFHGLLAGAPNNAIIAAHDSAHVSIGNTMAQPEIAAFDPVFFFFHANWDRLFWQWQKKMQATNLNGLLSTINKTTDMPSYQIFTVPVLEKLVPFPLSTLQVVDLAGSLDVDYADPKVPAPVLTMMPKKSLFVAASQDFSIQADRVNVRVQGVNRMKIPGSFIVHLLQDGKTIASTAFFQPNEVSKCENCVANPVVHFDFNLPLEQASKGKLSVWVEPVDKSFVGDRFPEKLMAKPTVNVQLLLSTE
jgi:hypothetical protein